ncbi:MAG: transcriptional regulator [Gomphosphaeria aponina SAG 52.96 = DSM 107014]|uniref:Transcriptional regulator n=1 Tax=Gomphosphaeria aponina SAG 52.96 = DSM 107014 TaxID=1521640 RepID=A0A941JRD3_9CHRO|nr:transcriptional regulator [Gomphosphaeria aponina SAG 52.96 = DSM 107014]
MTTGLEKFSNYYLNLITSFPPRPISNEQELIATQKQINKILDKEKLTKDDEDYLKLLGILVYEYENKHESIPQLERLELLKAILEEDNLQPQDLLSIFESEAVVLDILEGKIQMTDEAFNQLKNNYL